MNIHIILYIRVDVYCIISNSSLSVFTLFDQWWRVLYCCYVEFRLYYIIVHKIILFIAIVLIFILYFNSHVYIYTYKYI